MNTLQKSICFSFSLVWLASFIPCYALQGYNSSTRLYENGAEGLYDGSLHVTGANRTDKYFEEVGISTPTTPSANHVRIFLNNGTKQICFVFDNSTVSCGVAGGGGLLTDVTAGLGLSGGGSSGNVTVNLSTPITGSYLGSSSTNYIQNTSNLQANAVFNVASGTVAGNLSVSNIYVSSSLFISPAASDVPPGNFSSGFIANCTQIGTAGSSGPNTCFTRDIGTGTVAGEFDGLFGTVVSSNNAYSVYAENNITTYFPGITFAGLFYAANGQFQNIGVEGDAGEASGPGATNIAVNGHGNNKHGTDTCYGTKGLTDGAGTGIGGYFTSSSTGTSIGVEVNASSHAIQIDAGDVYTHSTAGTNGQVFTSGGPGLAPTWSTPSSVIVQKVSSIITASSGTSASVSFVPTNIVKSITPGSASNRVRITISAFMDVASSTLGNQCLYSLFKSSTTNLAGAQGFGYITNTISSITADVGAPINIVYEDSPASVSTITYGLYFLDQGANPGGGVCKFAINSQPGTIILEEVTPG